MWCDPKGFLDPKTSHHEIRKIHVFLPFKASWVTRLKPGGDIHSRESFTTRVGGSDSTVNALTALHIHMREECYIHSLKDTSSAGNIRSEHIWIGYEHYMAPKVLTGQKLISGVQVLFFTYCYVVSLLSWKNSGAMKQSKVA
ncbi:hypothetical protein YC2023_052269 [Brassica napus]